jgi:F0F1-type ATP synthase assembly protein I
MTDFDLQSKIAEMSTNIKLILKNQEDHEGRIRTLEQKPVRRWDSLITGIITGIVGVVIGILINGGVAK